MLERMEYENMMQRETQYFLLRVGLLIYIIAACSVTPTRDLVRVDSGLCQERGFIYHMFSPVYMS